MSKPVRVAVDAAAALFNLPDFYVVSVVVAAFGQRRVELATDLPPGPARPVG